jgi:hypothetical protein
MFFFLVKLGRFTRTAKTAEQPIGTYVHQNGVDRIESFTS